MSYESLADAEEDVVKPVKAYGDLIGVAAILAGSIRLFLTGDGTRENMEAALAEYDKRKQEP